MSAARREGVTLGEWLDRAIRHQVKAERSQEVGPTIEETLAKLAEGMARQAEATERQTAALSARLEAVERDRDRQGMAGGGKLFARLYGLLKGRQNASDQPA